MDRDRQRHRQVAAGGKPSPAEALIWSAAEDRISPAGVERTALTADAIRKPSADEVKALENIRASLTKHRRELIKVLIYTEGVLHSKVSSVNALYGKDGAMNHDGDSPDALRRRYAEKRASAESELVKTRESLAKAVLGSDEKLLGEFLSKKMQSVSLSPRRDFYKAVFEAMPKPSPANHARSASSRPQFTREIQKQ